MKTELEKKILKFLQEKISRYRAKIREEGKEGQVIRQIYESYQGSDEENQDNSTLPTQNNIQLSLNKENREKELEKFEAEANIIRSKKAKERTKDEKQKLKTLQNKFQNI